jgi:spore maturation protein CgeB
MRIFVAWGYFPRYLEQFYRKRPGLERCDSSAQLDALLADYFTWPVYVPLRLRERGHDVELSIVNARNICERWAEENGVAFGGPDAEFELLLERVKRWQPDVLYLGPIFSYYGPRVQQLRRHCRKVLTWIAAPLRPFMNFSGLDCIITSHANLAARFRSAGARSVTMLPAFEARMSGDLERPGAARDIEVSFIGSLSWAHGERMAALSQLVGDTPIRLWILDQPVFSRSMLRPAYYTTIWRYLRLRRRSEGEVFGMDMFRLLARSRMTINAHTSVAGGLAGNQRMFEATGAGALLLTEAAPNLADMFEPDSEVIGYRSVPDLVARVHELLDDPGRAAQIAARGQARTLRSHSALARSLELEHIFETA